MSAAEERAAEGPMMRGYIVQSCVAHVDRRYEATAKARIYAALPADVRARVGRYNDVEWVPRGHGAAFFRGIALNESGEDAAYRALFDCGRSIADAATHTFMKLLLKIITPALFAKKATDFWARDHRGGQLVADPSRLDENRMLLHLTDVEGFDFMAPTAAGFFTCTFEAMGKTAVDCKVSGWSMVRPGPRDVTYDLSWK